MGNPWSNPQDAGDEFAANWLRIHRHLEELKAACEAAAAKEDRDGLKRAMNIYMANAMQPTGFILRELSAKAADGLPHERREKTKEINEKFLGLMHDTLDLTALHYPEIRRRENQATRLKRLAKNLKEIDFNLFDYDEQIPTALKQMKESIVRSLGADASEEITARTASMLSRFESIIEDLHTETEELKSLGESWKKERESWQKRRNYWLKVIGFTITIGLMIAGAWQISGVIATKVAALWKGSAAAAASLNKAIDALMHAKDRLVLAKSTWDDLSPGQTFWGWCHLEGAYTSAWSELTAAQAAFGSAQAAVGSTSAAANNSAWTSAAAGQVGYYAFNGIAAYTTWVAIQHAFDECKSDCWDEAKALEMIAHWGECLQKVEAWQNRWQTLDNAARQTQTAVAMVRQQFEICKGDSTTLPGDVVDGTTEFEFWSMMKEPETLAGLDRYIESCQSLLETTENLGIQTKQSLAALCTPPGQQVPQVSPTGSRIGSVKSGCFLPMTMLWRSAVECVAVDSLRVGDMVLCIYNRPIKVKSFRVHEEEIQQVVELRTRASQLSVSADHRVVVPGVEGGPTDERRAGELQRGDLVFSGLHSVPLVGISSHPLRTKRFEITFEPDEPVSSFNPSRFGIITRGEIEYPDTEDGFEEP